MSTYLTQEQRDIALSKTHNFAFWTFAILCLSCIGFTLHLFKIEDQIADLKKEVIELRKQPTKTNNE
jgi:hypothetical protein